MKKILSFVGILTISTPFIMADFHIKSKTHTDAYYFQGTQIPAMDTESELWIGDKKIAAISKNRIIIIDKTKNRIFFVNQRTKTYVEASLPLDPSKLKSEQVSLMLQPIKFRLSTKATGETRKIKKWGCKGYDMNSWITEGENRGGDIKRKFWITRNVPFDLDLYNDLYTNVIKLITTDENVLNELDKLNGFLILSEVTQYNQGVSIKSRREVKEISQKNPPTGIYSAPDGYTKNEKLSIQDLQNLLND